jgi:peptidoglycan/xylan/chitin deacetylase (PgdA/CDA1 family)
VLTRVPTRDPVVFLTYDSTATARDPHLAALIRDLRLPVTLFLDERTTSPGHDPYGRLHALGAGIGNHTLTHPFLPGLGYARQHTEICAQQNNLKSRFGTAPRLLHPPSNTYDATTLRAAAACTITALILPTTPTPKTPLHRGDILHPRPTETPALLRHLQSNHLTPATLEDYV